MPHSMTAYASAQTSHDWGALSWEIRSVNHRHLEPSFYLPDTLRELEMPLRDQLARLVRRGKINCTLQLKPLDGSVEININMKVAQKYIEAGESLAKLITSPAPIDALDILNKPGVICADTIDSDLLKAAIFALFRQAMEQLIETRAREGDKLAELVRLRLADISHHTKVIRTAMPELINAQRQKLLNKFLEFGHQVDQERLEQELVYLAQKADIDEELDRLEVHVAEIYRILESDEAIGRRLDFLLQELNREANTLAAKSGSSSITHSAVELKVLIEQVREQSQNLE